MTAAARQLSLANRLRYRARLLRQRSGDVVEHAPAGQLSAALARGLRMQERAIRADRRASTIIRAIHAHATAAV